MTEQKIDPNVCEDWTPCEVRSPRGERYLQWVKRGRWVTCLYGDPYEHSVDVPPGWTIVRVLDTADPSTTWPVVGWKDVKPGDWVRAEFAIEGSLAGRVAYCEFDVLGIDPGPLTVSVPVVQVSSNGDIARIRRRPPVNPDADLLDVLRTLIDDATAAVPTDEVLRELVARVRGEGEVDA